jgi:hypothetical protein
MMTPTVATAAVTAATMPAPAAAVATRSVRRPGKDRTRQDQNPRQGRLFHQASYACRCVRQPDYGLVFEIF